MTRFRTALAVALATAALAPAQPPGRRGAPPTTAEVAAHVATVEALAAGTKTITSDEAKSVQDALFRAFRPPVAKDLEPLFDRTLKAVTGPNAPVPTVAKPVGDTNPAAKLALALRTKLTIQLPAEKVKADPAAVAFPGAVAADAKRVTKTVSVPTASTGYICNGYGVSSRSDIWHSTGLYAAPGAVVTVAVPASAAGKKLAVRVGCHADSLYRSESWKRAPEVTRTLPLDATETRIANPFGGPVYITVPPGTDLGTVDVKIAGAVDAPLYVRGKTTPEQWRESLKSAAPWAEIVGKNLILSVPTELAKKLADPAEVTAFWDSVLDHCADLTAVSRDRGRAERFVHDVQISAGYMHSGYPIMCPIKEGERALDLAFIQRDGAWGYFHELGHNHQQHDWTFDGTVEVTCNLYSLYVSEQVCPKAAMHGSFRPAAIARMTEKHRAAGAPFDGWKKDPFTALIVYKQFRDTFGWDTFKTAFTAYHALPAAKRPKTDAERRDEWLVQFSTAAKRNVGPAFEYWGIPVSDAAKKAVADLPAWSPTPEVAGGQ